MSELPPSKLSSLLTLAQRNKLADVLEVIVLSGFGEITITIQKGHVRFIRSTVSIEFPANDKLKGR